jgi:hypothetical protein
MKDAAWRVLSYVGFLGLFTYFYGRGDVARHGRRGFTVFVWEVIGFVLFDVVRVKFGWPTLTFAPVIGAVAVCKIILMVRAFRAAPPAQGRATLNNNLGGK